MKNKWLWIAVVFSILLTVNGFAQEAAAAGATAGAETPPDTVVTGWRAILMDLLLVVGTFGSTLLVWIIGVGKNKVAKTDAQKEAWDSLEAGVTSTYQTLYAELKAAAGDRKFTAAEKEQLRLNAIEQAKKIATGPALKVLQTTALPILKDWIERIVLNRKEQAGHAATE